MTYPPPPYSAYPMPQRTSSSPGRVAGIVLTILGSLALLFGGCMGVFAAIMPELERNPELQRQMQELTKIGVPIAVVFWIMAGVFLVYAILAIVLGVLLIRRVRAAVIIALVFVSLVTLLQALNLIVNLAGGQIMGAVLVAIIVGLHGWILFMLTQELRMPSQPEVPAIMPQYPGYYPQQYTQPMQGYYYQPPQQQAPQQPPQGQPPEQ